LVSEGADETVALAVDVDDLRLVGSVGQRVTRISPSRTVAQR
jgi:hypothetical protein